MSAHDYLCHATDCVKWAEGWIDAASFRHSPFNDVDVEHAKRLAERARKLADRLDELRVRNAA